jgi:hypothetical protein
MGAVDISSLGVFDGDLKLNQFVWPNNWEGAATGHYLRVKSPGSNPILEFASMDTLRNTTSLGGRIQIETASQQGDPAKIWSFDHGGAGSLILTDGSSIRAKHGFNILATEPDFVNFTGLNDFDTLSFHDLTNIVIINPQDSILAAIDPASPDCTAIIGATVRIMLNNGVVHNSQLTSTFVGEENNPVYGLPVWTATIPDSGIASSSIKEISIGNSANWRFDTDGVITFPNNALVDSSDSNIEFRGMNNFNVEASGVVNIVTDSTDTAYSWQFGDDGSLTLPNNALQRDSANTTCAANADTLIYADTNGLNHTIKLIVQVEGLVGNESTTDTQSCEILVARSINGNRVSATTYAVVHTSVSPLATFAASWNSGIGRVVVTCRPTSLTNGVTVRTFATEIKRA